MTEFLEQKKIKELRTLARQAGVVGWHEMRKKDIIEALEQSVAIPVKTAKPLKKPASSSAVASAGQTEFAEKADKGRTVPLDSDRVPTRKKAASVKLTDKGTFLQEVEPMSGGQTKRVEKKRPEKLAAEKSVAENNLLGKSSSLKPLPEKKNSEKKTSSKKQIEKNCFLFNESDNLPFMSETKPESVTESGKLVRKKAEDAIDTLAKKEKGRKIVQSTNDQRPASLEPIKIEPTSGAKKAADKVVPKENEKKKKGSSDSDSALPKSTTSVAVKEEPLDEVQQRIQLLKEKLLLHKTLGATVSNSNRKAKDQLILMVRDPFWLHAYWEISAPLVERIRAAMGHLWHTADPILRLYKIHVDNVGALRQEYITDIQIHGGINNWYIDVDDPPSSFLVEIGYLARDGQFFVLLSSNIVETPQRYIHDAFGHPDVSWMGIPPDFCSGVFSDTLGPDGFRTSSSSRPDALASLVPEEPVLSPQEIVRDFTLQVDSEVVIKGKTEPGVQLSIKGEKIRLKDDGTFSIRYHLPERRHVFNIVAVSSDGMETQTVILAFERNTKVLETVIKDEDLE